METKKLTAKDLMIGDWVLCVDSTHEEKTYAQIDAIEEGQTCILVRKDNCNWFLDIGFIEAIPLTAEVLEKNNFEKHYDDDIIIYTHPQGIIIEMGINYKLFDDGHFFVRGILQRFYFVHELQRALKLSKINKDIVL
jgi:hypothetical protein